MNQIYQKSQVSSSASKSSSKMVSSLGALEGLRGISISEGATSIHGFMLCLISFAIAVNCIKLRSNVAAAYDECLSLSLLKERKTGRGRRGNGTPRLLVGNVTCEGIYRRGRRKEGHVGNERHEGKMEELGDGEGSHVEDDDWRMRSGEDVHQAWH